MDLQQRSVEFGTIFRRFDHLRAGLLERMPIVRNTSRVSANDLGVGIAISADGDGEVDAEGDRQTNANDEVDERTLLANGEHEPSSIVNGHKTHDAAPKTNVADILNLFDDAPAANAAPAPPKAATANSNPPAAPPPNSLDLFDLLGVGNASPPPAAPAVHSPQSPPALPNLVAFDKAGVNVQFAFIREAADSATRVNSVTALVSNSNAFTIENFVLQIAVPKVRCCF